MHMYDKHLKNFLINVVVGCHKQQIILSIYLNKVEFNFFYKIDFINKFWLFIRCLLFSDNMAKSDSDFNEEVSDKNMEIFNINVFLQLYDAIVEERTQQQITGVSEKVREAAIRYGDTSTIVQCDNEYQINLGVKHIKVDNVNDIEEQRYQASIQRGKILTFLRSFASIAFKCKCFSSCCKMYNI